MEERLNNTIQNEAYDEIDLMELLRKLIKNYKVLIRWTLIAMCFGFVFALSSIKSYTTTSHLAPEMSSNRTSGSISSLASLAGINLNTNTSNAIYPELYPSIVNSTAFIADLFSAPVKYKDKKKNIIETDYYTYIKEYTKTPWYSYVMSAPGKFLSWVIKLIKGEDEEVEGFANLDFKALTREQDKVKRAISENINIVVDKKTSEITLSVSAQNPTVAYQISEYVIEQLKNYVVEYRTEKSRVDVEYYEQLYNDAKKDYFEAQQEYANYVDANQSVVLLRVRTEQERLQNEMNLCFQLYNSCAQQLQVAKAKLQQDTPVFVTVDPPTRPIKPSSMSRMMILIVVSFLGFCCACVWVLFLKEKIAEFKAGSKK